jgi:peptide/nickel transport system substrate-binding protein
MNLATYYGFTILPRHVLAGADVRQNAANWKPIGSGPFKFVEHVRGSHVTLAANTDYFKGRPYLDRIVFKVITNRPVVFSALKAGEIHLSLVAAPFPEIPQLQAAPKVRVALPPANRPQTLHFNLRKAPFSDVRVRRAIAQAINREEINQKVFSGMLKPAAGTYVPTNVWFFNPAARQPAFNLAEAERVLDEAGLKRGPDGVRLKTRYAGWIALTYGGREVGEVLKEQLKKVGIDLTLEIREAALFKDVILDRRDFDLVWAAGEMGPDPSVFYNFVGSKGFRNVMGYESPKVDALFEQALRTVSLEERKKLYGEIQQIVADDLPQINLVEYTDPWAYRTDFHGFPWEQIGAGRLNRDDYSLVWWEGAKK